MNAGIHKPDRTDKASGGPNAIRVEDTQKCKRVRVAAETKIARVLTKMKSLMYEDW